MKIKEKVFEEIEKIEKKDEDHTCQDGEVIDLTLAEVEKVIDGLWEGQKQHTKCYIIEKEGHKICLKCEIEKFRKELKQKLGGNLK